MIYIKQKSINKVKQVAWIKYWHFLKGYRNRRAAIFLSAVSTTPKVQMHPLAKHRHHRRNKPHASFPIYSCKQQFHHTVTAPTHKLTIFHQIIIFSFPICFSKIKTQDTFLNFLDFDS